MRLFYEPCVPIFEGVPHELYILRPKEEVKAWADSYGSILIRAADSITGYVNLYSFITDLGISKEEAEKALERYLASDDWQINISREGFDSIFAGDIAAVTREFATEYSIVVGDRIYSPFWVYSHPVEDYEAVGITKDDISKMLEHINAFHLSDEAREAFEAKLNKFIGSDGRDKMPEPVNPGWGMGGSDFTFSREFIDSVYNIYIVSQIVGQEARDEWVNNVYLKQTREEMCALPDLYQAIVALNVSREEFERENNKYIDYPGMYYTEDIIDALYLDDVEEMKRLLTNPFALYYDGEIYTFDRLSQDPKRAEDIPADVLNEYLYFIESVCQQEGLIKYMQEDIDRVRQHAK